MRVSPSITTTSTSRGPRLARLDEVMSKREALDGRLFFNGPLTHVSARRRDHHCQITAATGVIEDCSGATRSGVNE